MPKRVWLVDAGTGNLRSVQHALQTLGAEVIRTDQPQDLQTASGLVLPGVGAFGEFMKGMDGRGLSGAVRDCAVRGIPILGICVGMQAFFETSYELGEFPGLGLLPGGVQKFPDIAGLKVPHTGWNQLHPLRDDPLLEELDEGSFVYFNHSFYCAPEDDHDVLAQTDYGINYASMVHRENLYGVQFHPEKSQTVGLALLANFLKLV